MDGFVIIDKEKDMTSFDVVYKVKKIFNTKKVGHSGTLDPMATGVLVVGVNRATKFLQFITDSSYKEYIADIKLGQMSDTLDTTGEITQDILVDEISDEQLNQVIAAYIKTYDQIPPKFSAKKIDGKRAYDLARDGKEVVLKPCEVTIYDAKLIKRIDNENISVYFKVSKGTYIRSLIDDIARDLGTIGIMSGLRRTSTDNMTIEQAKLIGELTTDDLIPLHDVARMMYSEIFVDGNLLRMVDNGVPLDVKDFITYPCIYSNKETGQPVSIYDEIQGRAKLIFKF